MTVHTNPYLTGNCAPVDEEVTAFDLNVRGTIPQALEGRWIRNGPNPRADIDPATHHWFLGHGMVHGVRLRGGRAEWYRNRWVRSDALAVELGETVPGGPSFGDRDFGPNTNVGGWAGTTWAMVEAGATPVELTYELDTVARNDFHGTLPGAFSAHPKFDPHTRELHAMTYAWPDWLEEGKIQYVVVGEDGRVSRTVDIPVPGMVMVHDMSLTDRYAVVYDLPVTVDLDLAFQERFPFTWNADYEPRVGLLSRHGTAADIIWCEAPQSYVFHPLNAYDTEDGRVVIDVCRYERMFDSDILGPFGDTLPTLNRWEIDPAAGKVSESVIDDRPQEFPRHNNSVGGRKHQFGYTSMVDLTSTPGQIHGPILKVDVDSGVTTEHHFGPGRGGAEPVFVADPEGHAEDDGWLLTVVYDAGTDRSELHILDARDVTAPAVGVIELPQRVPFGFHGNWVSDTSVAPS